MTPIRFCFTFAAAAVTITAGIASFNFAVDPYLLFDMGRTPGFNERKPAVETRERMMKAYQAERVTAQTVILGSSRTDLGIDPASGAWPADSLPVYNLSLVGSDTATGLRYLQHFYAGRPTVKTSLTVIVGLDFETFLIKPPAGAADDGAVPTTNNARELEDRLAVTPNGSVNPARPLRILKDRATGLLSLDAVIDSVTTIASNRSANAADIGRNGFLSDAIFRQNAAADGLSNVFDKKNLDTVKQYGIQRRALSPVQGGQSSKLVQVSELLNFAKDHNMKVILAIQPAHVSRLELLDRLGYWRDYERWKRELTAMVAGARTRQQVALWDFGGYDHYAQEPVPAKQSGSGGMKWFWDPVHYRSALGDIMVSRMLNRGETLQFGAELTPKNLSEHLISIRRERKIYRLSNAAEIARLGKLACDNAPCPVQDETLAASL